MEQYTKLIMNVTKRVMDNTKFDKEYSVTLKEFLSNYLKLMKHIGFDKYYNVITSKLSEDKLLELSCKTASKQVNSKKFGITCSDEKCLRTKMACNIIDNIMILVPMSITCNNNVHRMKLSEVINYANNNGTYNYLYNIMNTMYKKDDFDKDNTKELTNKLDEYISKYNNLKLKLAKYY